MRIAVIGAGHAGAGIGMAWLEQGHDVVWGVRDPSKYGDLPVERLLSPQEAAATAEALLLAVPWHAAEAALAELGPLDGKLLLDATNPLGMGADGLHLTEGFSTSGGEKVAGWAPGAKVVKTLNQTGAANLGHARRYAEAPLMFLAGDDGQAKQMASALVADLGFNPVDAGPLDRARLLEPLAMLWIEQAMKHGRGPDFALTLVEPAA
jgi:predicted dinucleotide-binding enzyme